MGEGRGERTDFLVSLMQNRAASFRKEIFPYFRYVAQSGFGLFVSAALFALIIGYANLLRDVPPDFPAVAAGTALIATAAVRAPLRTYLIPADPVFLLPMESAVIRDYIRPALAASLRAGAIRTLAAYLIFIPLYISAPVTETAASGRPLWLPGVLFAALGAWNAYGGWKERQTAYPSRRILLRAARYSATLAAVWALLVGSPLPAIGLSAGLLILVALGWKLPVRHRLPWDMLILEESAVRRRWYRFLSWFVDVPAGESKPAGRSWAAWPADRLPWDRRLAWHYLYAKTFVRSETFGAWLRWHAVAVLIVFSANHPLTDWIAYGIGFMVGGIQLSELAGLRLALSMQTLPVREEGRRTAAASIARVAGLTGTLLLGLFTVIHEATAMSWLAPAALAAGCLWNGWLIPRRIAKPRDDDDE